MLPINRNLELWLDPGAVSWVGWEISDIRSVGPECVVVPLLMPLPHQVGAF